MYTDIFEDQKVHQKMIPQQGLANAIMAMGGTLFNQVMRVEPKGDYVFKSQLESLVGLLNRASYKLETIEDEVQDTELLLQVLFGGLGVLGLLIGVLFYLVCRSSKELEAKMTTKIGSSIKTTIFQGGDEDNMHGKGALYQHPRAHGSAPYPGPSKTNLNFEEV